MTMINAIPVITFVAFLLLYLTKEIDDIFYMELSKFTTQLLSTTTLAIYVIAIPTKIRVIGLIALIILFIIMHIISKNIRFCFIEKWDKLIIIAIPAIHIAIFSIIVFHPDLKMPETIKHQIISYENSDTVLIKISNDGYNYIVNNETETVEIPIDAAKIIEYDSDSKPEYSANAGNYKIFVPKNKYKIIKE